MDQAPAIPILPRAQVLSYVATADSPTRVRQIAARAVFVLAILHVAGAVFFLVIMALELVRVVNEFHALPLPLRPPLSRALHEAWKHSGAPIVFVVFFSTMAVLLFACAGPIRRGRKIACHLGMSALVPSILALLGVSTVCGLAIFISISEGARTWAIPIYLVLGIALIIPMLLLCDLCGFLLWIAKTPITEKPPVPFIPPSGTKP